MATYYSDHFTTQTGLNATSAVAGHRTEAGINHGRLRYKKASWAGDTANADIVRLMTFKSSDRIIQIFFSSDGGGAAGNTNFGLYKSGASNDGAVLDKEIFGSDVDTFNVVDRADQFIESTTLTSRDRGKALWQIADISASLTYASDPGEFWDLCLTFDTGGDAVQTLTIEVIYTSGD